MKINSHNFNFFSCVVIVFHISFVIMCIFWVVSFVLILFPVGNAAFVDFQEVLQYKTRLQTNWPSLLAFPFLLSSFLMGDWSQILSLHYRIISQQFQMNRKTNYLTILFASNIILIFYAIDVNQVDTDVHIHMDPSKNMHGRLIQCLNLYKTVELSVSKVFWVRFQIIEILLGLKRSKLGLQITLIRANISPSKCIYGFIVLKSSS